MPSEILFTAAVGMIPDVMSLKIVIVEGLSGILDPIQRKLDRVF